YPIQGKVIRGDQIGRSISYPTANIFLEENYKLIPADGIYAVSVQLPSSEIRYGMAYIGNRPTINGMSRNIEVHIFDFDADLYNQIIRINFLHFIRGDRKFDSLEELKEALTRDEIAVKA